MNRIIDRDSDAMRQFAASLEQFSSDLSYTVGDLLASCYDASDMMRDDSGQQALYLLMDIAEDIKVQISAANRVAENLKISAKLVEDSDELL